MVNSPVEALYVYNAVSVVPALSYSIVTCVLLGKSPSAPPKPSYPGLIGSRTTSIAVVPPLLFWTELLNFLESGLYSVSTLPSTPSLVRSATAGVFVLKFWKSWLSSAVAVSAKNSLPKASGAGSMPRFRYSPGPFKIADVASAAIDTVTSSNSPAAPVPVLLPGSILAAPGVLIAYP